jgi:hypothetical protein
MLEDVPGLINPIIQAMIATSRQQGESADRAQRLEEIKQRTAENLARTKMEEAHYNRADTLAQQEHEDRQDYMKNVSMPMLQAQLEMNRIERAKQIRELIRSGVDPDKAVGMINAGTYGDPSDPFGIKGGGSSQQPASTGQPTQQQILDSINVEKQGEARATALGTGTGQAQAALSQPGTDVFNRFQVAQKEEDDRKNQQAQLLANMREDRDDRRETIRQAGENSRANITGAYHLKGIALMHQLGLDPGDGSVAQKAKTLLDGIYDGTTDPDKMSKDDKQLVTNYAVANGETVPTGEVFKTYRSTLANASAVQGILSQARDAAQKYSLDSPGSTAAGNKNMGMGPFGVHSPMPGTDANGLTPGSPAHAAIEGLGTTVGKFIPTLEGSQRQSDQNIARQLSGLVDPKNTVAMNTKNINDKAALINQQLRTGTQGVNPDRLNVALQKRGIVDFGGQNTPAAYKQTATGPNGHKIGSNDGQKWFDIQTGNPIVAQPVAQ